MGRAIHLETWYDRLNRLAGDLYPGRYTRSYVKNLVAVAREVRVLVHKKGSVIVAHNYVYPELQEVADAVGDSLGLSRFVARKRPTRVDFCGVWFMGETAKIIVGGHSKVYMPDQPGCSLVESVDHRRLRHWMAGYPNGIVITYVNSDARAKALSHYVCTSGNAARVLRHAARVHPGRRILFLPDKYLGTVALAEAQVPPDLVDLYDGSCHVHAAIDKETLLAALDRHPDAEPLVHPECACVASYLSQKAGGRWRLPPIRFLSSEQMLHQARESPAREFLVATEKGMVYKLRKELAEKKFYPLSDAAVCEYMKMNTLEKLLRSLQRDAIEVGIEARVSRKAKVPISRMIAIR